MPPCCDGCRARRAPAGCGDASGHWTTISACIWLGCRPQATAYVPGGTGVGFSSRPVQVRPLAPPVQVHLLPGVMSVELVGNGLVPGIIDPTFESGITVWVPINLGELMA